MSALDDRHLTSEERAEILKRTNEVGFQKKTKQATSLSELKKELGLPAKDKQK